MQIEVLRELSSNNNNQYKKQEQESFQIKLSSEMLKGDWWWTEIMQLLEA